MQTALRNFKTSLDRVRLIADDVEARLLSPTVNAAVRTSTQTICCGAIVVTSGYFESFLSDVAKAFIKDVCSCGTPFLSLPQKIQTTHFSDGSRFLHNLTKNKFRWHSTTKEDVLRRLNTVLATLPYELVWEAFADTNSNPGVQTVEEILQKCGVKNIWPLLSTETRLPDQTIKAKIDGFVTLRNECAHTGTALTIPGPSELRNSCDDLSLIAEAIVKVLEQHFSTIKPVITPALATVAASTPPTP